MHDPLFLETDHGKIAYRQTRTHGPALLLIHGNSSCKEIFVRQCSDPRFSSRRLVAFDLPGHGGSDDARDPERSYTLSGYADVAEQVIEKLGLGRPAIFGWSLGGHIGLEMIGLEMPVERLMISGTPPVKPDLESVMAGFNSDPESENLTAKRDFTDADAAIYATLTSHFEGKVEPHFLAMCKRTDGRAREIMFASILRGEPCDERRLVETMSVPLAIVNGHDDVFLRPDYFDTLSFGSLWKHGVVRLQGAAHAPFLQQPEAFNALLEEFVKAG